MRVTPLRRSGLLASVALAAAASLVLATSASADEVTTDDPRAQPFFQFIDVNHPDACAVGGLSGNVVLPGEFGYTGGDNQKHLNITGLPEDVEVTGMLVKAGDVFNVYLADELGDALPWNELRAPVVDGGTLPEIGQWFGCGVAVEQPPTGTTTTTTTTTTTSEPTVTHSSTPTSTSRSEPTTSSSSTEAAPTTTTVAPVPVAEVRDLAATGFGSAWLLGCGAALVAAGAAVLFVMRRRRA